MTELELSKVEEILQYHFKDRRLLVQALTHTSYANEMQGDPSLGNERLEFLGDAALELVSSRWLYDHLDLSEGELSRRRAQLVCEASLSALAQRTGMGAYLLLGKGAEKTGGRKHPPILEDLMESLFGAIFLDSGLEAVTDVICRLLLEPQREVILQAQVDDNTERKLEFHDYKTKFQEWAQSQPSLTFEYKTDRVSGPPHHPQFDVSLWCGGEEVGKGTGHSKKEAEQKAAAMALKSMGN